MYFGNERRALIIEALESRYLVIDENYICSNFETCENCKFYTQSNESHCYLGYVSVNLDDNLFLRDLYQECFI